MIYCSRKLEFDAGHRLVGHEGKCRNLHGHRYSVDIAFAAPLNELGIVIDFGTVKSIIGTWIDENLDHGVILNEKDTELIELCNRNKWKLFVMKSNPTAENIAELIYHVSKTLIDSAKIEAVRVYETPNCWATAI